MKALLFAWAVILTLTLPIHLFYAVRSCRKVFPFPYKLSDYPEFVKGYVIGIWLPFVLYDVKKEVIN